MQMPSTRVEAKDAGAKTYFTGSPCPRGHIAERRTHNSECVECGRAAARQKALELDPVIKAERGKAYHARNRARLLAKKRKHYAENKAEIRGRNRVRDVAWNAGPGKEYKRKWTQENKDKYRVYKQRRRGRLKAADGSFTHGDVVRIFKAQGYRCAVCKKKEKLTIDHIIPLARGGTNWPKNLQGLCQSCNRSKNAKDPIEFMQSRGALL